MTRHPATLFTLGALLTPGCGSEPMEWAAPAGSVTTPDGTIIPAPSGTAGSPTPSVLTAPDLGETSSLPPSTQPGATPDAMITPQPSLAPELAARTWRLTHDQYRRTISALFAIDVDLSNFAPESGNGTYVNFSSTAFVRQDLASNYLSTAKQVVAALDRAELQNLTTCSLLPECSADFITELGRRVFRRPVPAEVATSYRELVDLAVASGDPEAGFRAVLIAMLNSPLFLYRSELGDEASVNQPRFELTNHELANALSFSLIGQAPPAWLADLADAGQLSDRTAIARAVERLLDDPAANDELRRFLTEWLEVHDFEQTTKSDVFPGFDAAKPYLWQELSAFLANNGRQTNSLTDLLGGDVPEISPALTQYYFSDDSAPLDRTLAGRAGVLSLGIVLADHAKSYLTSPTLRGTFVRKRFFCQEITLPPNFTPPPLSQTEALRSARTTRELYEQHQADPTCAPCHDLTDNIGFVLEEFDGAGRIRTLDTTQGSREPLNLTAPLTGTDVNRTLNSVRDLNTALIESETVRHCLARQAFRFYFGQGESSSELPPIQRASEAAADSTLGALLEGLFTTESTFLRVREPAL